MPNPGTGETEQEFISRCIKQEIQDGAAQDEKQAAAICYSKWREKSKAASTDGAADYTKPATLRARIIAAVESIFGGGQQHAAKSTLRVYKQSDNAYRWLAISSSGYQDRDGEFVTTEALEKDAERMTSEKSYGPLRWWHVGKPDPEKRLPGHGLDLGDCDFSAVHNHLSIESGTFKSAWVGEYMQRLAPELGLSRGFFHAPVYPDAEKSYRDIYTFERSVMPSGRESNLLTGFTVGKEIAMPAMTSDKVKELVAKFGGDTRAVQFVEEFLSVADLKEADAQSIKVALKEISAKQEAVKCPDCGHMNGAGSKYCSECGAKLSGPETSKEGQGASGIEKPVTVSALKEAMDALRAELKPTPDGQSEAQKAEMQKAIALQASKFEEMVKQVGDVQKTLKELQGDIPAAVRAGFRASQSDGTLISGKQVKDLQPPLDPLLSIVDALDKRAVAPTG